MKDIPILKLDLKAKQISDWGYKNDEKITY